MLDLACPALTADERDRARANLLLFAGSLVAKYPGLGTLGAKEQYVIEGLGNCLSAKNRLNSIPVQYIATAVKNAIYDDLRTSKQTRFFEPCDLDAIAKKRPEFQDESPESALISELDAAKIIGKLIVQIESNKKKYRKRFPEYFRKLAADRNGEFLSIAANSGEWIWHENIAGALGISPSTAHRLRNELTRLRTLVIEMMRESNT